MYEFKAARINEAFKHSKQGMGKEGLGYQLCFLLKYYYIHTQTHHSIVTEPGHWFQINK